MHLSAFNLHLSVFGGLLLQMLFGASMTASADALRHASAKVPIAHKVEKCSQADQLRSQDTDE